MAAAHTLALSSQSVRKPCCGTRGGCLVSLPVSPEMQGPITLVREKRSRCNYGTNWPNTALPPSCTYWSDYMVSHRKLVPYFKSVQYDLFRHSRWVR